jgi:hypothetical protein
MATRIMAISDPTTPHEAAITVVRLEAPAVTDKRVREIDGDAKYLKYS